ncbi:Uncharacterised protein [Vibrio cholerae]|nr:Uncharacterised protein [Vibrio cholerae]
MRLSLSFFSTQRNKSAHSVPRAFSACHWPIVGYWWAKIFVSMTS